MQLVQDNAPVRKCQSPLLRDVHNDQVKDFKQRLISRERTLIFGDFPDTSIQIPNRIRRIHQSPDFRRVFEERGKSSPISPPTFQGIGIFVPPPILEPVQGLPAALLVGCSIDSPSCQHRMPSYPYNLRISLNFGFGERYTAGSPFEEISIR